MKRDEKFAQVIPAKHPDNLVCLACNEMKCDHDEKLKRLLHYVNCWADVNAYGFNQEEKNIYNQCVDDIFQTMKIIYQGEKRI